MMKVGASSYARGDLVDHVGARGGVGKGDLGNSGIYINKFINIHVKNAQASEPSKAQTKLVEDYISTIPFPQKIITRPPVNTKHKRNVPHLRGVSLRVARAALWTESMVDLRSAATKATRRHMTAATRRSLAMVTCNPDID